MTIAPINDRKLIYIYTYFIREKKNEEDRHLRKSVFPSNTIFFSFFNIPGKVVPRLWICEDEQKGWQTGGSLLNWRTVHASGRRSLASSQRIFRPLLKLEIHSFCVQTPYQEHAASPSSVTIVVACPRR